MLSANVTSILLLVIQVADTLLKCVINLFWMIIKTRKCVLNFRFTEYSMLHRSFLPRVCYSDHVVVNLIGRLHTILSGVMERHVMIDNVFQLGIFIFLYHMEIWVTRQRLDSEN